MSMYTLGDPRSTEVFPSCTYGPSKDLLSLFVLRMAKAGLPPMATVHRSTAAVFSFTHASLIPFHWEIFCFMCKSKPLSGIGLMACISDEGLLLSGCEMTLVRPSTM